MHAVITKRVKKIQQWLKENNLAAFLIPHDDEYLNEYVAPHNERLAWATGFTGSAGAAVITQDDAAIFVDGRYVVQVRKQAPSIFKYCHLIENPPTKWLAENIKNNKNKKVAFDPKLHSVSWLSQVNSTFAGNLEFTQIIKNPIDEMWTDKPQAENSKIRIMENNIAGKSSLEKRDEIAKELQIKNIDSLFISNLDSICWLLNIRGNDIPCIPVLLTQAILNSDGSLFIYLTKDRLSKNFAQHVDVNVIVKDPKELVDDLHTMQGKDVLVEPQSCNAWIYTQLQQHGAILHQAMDPCQLPKACKNEAEVNGMKRCHIQDASIMVQFLAWLDNQIKLETLPNEAQVADKLDAMRLAQDNCLDLSFATISAAASNAAMCHYNHNNEAKPKQLEQNSLYLVDSGAQYTDGTTDITRTIAIGTPSKEMQHQYTLVLKGHIALAQARFIKGTTGAHLDILARQFLWAEGFDFDHGTGHGVGHNLSVHEGPQRISKVSFNAPMLPGMVVSNEPGYYKAGAFGIRIENLELVTKIQINNGEQEIYGFEPLTFVPIDTKLIDTTMLTPAEISWINEYHKSVLNKVSPLLDTTTQDWLKNATLPL